MLYRMKSRLTKSLLGLKAEKKDIIEKQITQLKRHKLEDLKIVKSKVELSMDVVVFLFANGSQLPRTIV